MLRSRVALTGTIKPFDQSAYTGPDSASRLSLDKTGYVFVPKACEQGEACRVHIALHGCKQNAGEIQPALHRRMPGTMPGPIPIA